VHKLYEFVLANQGCGAVLKWNCFAHRAFLFMNMFLIPCLELLVYIAISPSLELSFFISWLWLQLLFAFIH